MRDAPTLLIIDDDDAIRRIARLGLQRHGLRVLEAATGHDGVATLAARGAEVDLVVLDLGLPDLAGVEVFHRLRASWAGPVLFHSGRPDEAELVNALGDPATAFLAKPWTLTAFTDAVLARLPPA